MFCSMAITIFCYAQRVGHDAGAVDHLVGMLAHHAVVAGEVGFALGAVEQQDFELVARAEIQLDRRGEGGAAHADDARLGDAFADQLRVGVQGIGDGLGQVGPFVLAVRLEDDGGLRQARGMRRGDIRYCLDAARGRGMLGCGDPALAARDQLAFPDQVACLHQRLGGGADVLLQGNVEQVRQRQGDDGLLAGLLLAVVGMDAAADGEKLHLQLLLLVQHVFGFGLWPNARCPAFPAPGAFRSRRWGRP